MTVIISSRNARRHIVYILTDRYSVIFICGKITVLVTALRLNAKNKHLVNGNNAVGTFLPEYEINRKRHFSCQKIKVFQWLTPTAGDGLPDTGKRPGIVTASKIQCCDDSQSLFRKYVAESV